MDKEIINPKRLFNPAKYGYSHVVRANGLIFVAGQVATDLEGEVVSKGDIRGQAIQAFENLKTALEGAGATLEDVVKMNIYLVDMEHRREVAEVRGRYLKKDFPALTMVGVKSLAWPDLLIEVEAVALLRGGRAKPQTLKKR